MKSLLALLVLLSASTWSLTAQPATAYTGPTAVSGVAPQAVSSPDGYTFQVPTGWQSVTPQAGPPTPSLRYQSPDGGEAAAVFDGQRLASDPSDPIAFLDMYLPAQFGSLQDFQMEADPKLITGVSGADSAADAAFGYTDSQGTPYLDALVLAFKGNTVYQLIVDVPVAWAQQNANVLDAILNSFALTT